MLYMLSSSAGPPWSKVGLDLLLGVLVHAEPHLGGLAAAHEALDSSHVLHAGHVVHVVKLGGLVLSDLMAAVKDGEVLLLEPLAGHLVVVSISLHGINVDLVAGVEDVHLPEDAGHVAQLAHMLRHQVLELLLEAVVEFEGVTGLSLLESTHESLHHWAVVVALVGVMQVMLLSS